jgi:hypothetical protein
VGVSHGLGSYGDPTLSAVYAILSKVINPAGEQQVFTGFLNVDFVPDCETEFYAVPFGCIR